MKAQAFRDLSVDDLRSRIQELRVQLLKLRFQKSIGQIENPQLLRSLRRDIARALTVLRERELAGERPASETTAAGRES